MRYVTLKNARPGMYLAYELYDSLGRTLIGGKCRLTEAYIEKLEEYGFDGIYIEDQLAEGIDIDSVISPHLRVDGLVSVREQNIDRCHEIASRIVDEILDHGVISLDLTDLRAYDDYTYAHSVNVAVLSCVIGMGMKLGETALTHLVMAGLLHDMGKLQIPDEILNKPERLTPEEYQIMKSHATLSYELIGERWDISAHVKTAVHFHHENMDGSGYPQGLDGSEQTLLTRILHVADVYDALISKRPYKKPYSPYEATEYLMGGCGIMFDQKVVEALLQYVPLFPKGTDVELSDGRPGIIFENSGIHNLRPIVRLFDGKLLDLTAPENLHLTLSAITEEEQGVPELEEAERREMVKPLRRYRIMAVDDMKTNLQMLRGILEHLYDLTLVRTGRQALMYLEKHEYPDLILMDIDMPEMNGIETAGRIQEMTGGTVPILFVTALSDKETVVMCRNMNAAGYIVRPYKPVYIKSEIRRILTGRSEVE